MADSREELRRRREAEERRARWATAPFLGPAISGLDQVVEAAIPVASDIWRRFDETTPEQPRQPAKKADPRVIFDVPGAVDKVTSAGARRFNEAVRSPATGPIGQAMFVADAVKALGPRFGIGDTPDEGSAPKPTGSPTQQRQAWATSFRDPLYDQVEQQAARELGLGADYVAAVKNIRTLGERSNNGQVSSAGAKTPYQFIPQTREGFIKNYGIDPWKDPLSGAKAAMLHLKESRDRGNDMTGAIGEYIGGPDRSRWGPQTQAYIERVAGVGGSGVQMPNWQNPFDAAQPYWQQAMNEVDRGFDAAMQPSEFNIAMPAGPQIPGAPTLPDRDFTDTDRLLETLRPVMIGEVEQKRLQRANLFQGLAQGLAAIPEGAHWGVVLGRIGAGMMAGKAAGDKELQAYADRFDEKMAAFNMINFQYGRDKSQALYQDAVNEATMLYNHNMTKWQADRQDFTRWNNVDLQGNNVVVMQRTDAGVKLQTMPVKPMLEAARSAAKASIMANQASGAQQGASVEASATNQILAGVFGQQYARGVGEQNGELGIQGFLTNTFMQADEVIRSGIAPDLIAPTPEQGAAAYKTALDRAHQQALEERYTPGSKEYTERVQDIVTMGLGMQMLQNEELAKRIGGAAPALWRSRQTRRMREVETTERTDSRGRTTVTERY